MQRGQRISQLRLRRCVEFFAARAEKQSLLERVMEVHPNPQQHLNILGAYSPDELSN
jgi:hypothetical protein